MSDINSELPIRTQLPGQVNYDDVIVKIGDGTTPSQLASVDTHGSLQSRIADASGNVIASQTLSTSIWLQAVSPSNGPASPGTSASFASLMAGQFNTALPTLSNGQQAAVQVDSSGRLWANVTNLPATVDTNYGTVGASTIRTASEIGNATGAADFNNGSTGAQTLRTAANLAVSGANVSITNPVPVTVVDTAPGVSYINDYNTAAAIAAGATSNHDYSITSGKTFRGSKFWASASGKLKIEVQISPDGVTFTSKWVGFNSTATPNIPIDLDTLSIAESGTGAKIRIIRTNEDKVSQDVYSTISGTEQ